MICLLFLQMDLSLPFVETDRWYWWYINLDQKLRARLILPSLCFPMGVLGMSFYRCVILISWQMSYILFLPIPPPHHCPHGPHQCPCAGPLGSRSFEPRSPNLPSGHPNTLLLLHLHLIRCFKNAMPKSALSPPLTSGHSHPPILSHHYTAQCAFCKVRWRCIFLWRCIWYDKKKGWKQGHTHGRSGGYSGIFWGKSRI